MSTRKKSVVSTKKNGQSTSLSTLVVIIVILFLLGVLLDLQTGSPEVDNIIHSIHVSYVKPLFNGDRPAPTPPAVPTTTPTNSEALEGELLVQFIDVGQADCILAQFGELYMLVDAGNNRDGKLLVNYFKELGINSFEYVICTHAHEDHCGGIDDILENFDTKTIILPYADCDSATWEDVLNAASESNGVTLEPHVGDKYRFGDASFVILCCDEGDSSNQNLASIVIKLSYGDIDYMLTGDAEAKNEREMLGGEIPVECEILKAGHHGSLTSNSVDWLTEVNPEVIVISVGKDNKYNLPNKRVLERFENLGISPLRTDELGSITIVTNGVSYNIFHKQTNTNS